MQKSTAWTFHGRAPFGDIQTYPSSPASERGRGSGKVRDRGAIEWGKVVKLAGIKPE
jgi:hypothetical protein